ncbi:hypothetical protein BKA81DRAFT_352352, partial [Phyllosticta paracitricarpa]
WCLFPSLFSDGFFGSVLFWFAASAVVILRGLMASGMHVLTVYLWTADKRAASGSFVARYPSHSFPSSPTLPLHLSLPQSSSFLLI